MASWPLNPANGDRHKEGDRTWIYNGGIWDSVGDQKLQSIFTGTYDIKDYDIGTTFFVNGDATVTLPVITSNPFPVEGYYDFQIYDGQSLTFAPANAPDYDGINSTRVFNGKSGEENSLVRLWRSKNGIYYVAKYMSDKEEEEPTNRVFGGTDTVANNQFDINNSSIYYVGDKHIRSNAAYEIWTKAGLYGINCSDNAKMRVVIWSTNADGSAKTNIFDYYSFDVVSKHVKSSRLWNTGGEYIDVELTLKGFDARSTYEDFNFVFRAKSKTNVGQGRFYIGLGKVSGFTQFVQFVIWRSIDIFEISKW